MHAFMLFIATPPSVIARSETTKQSRRIAKKVTPVFFEIKPHKLKMFNASYCWIATQTSFALNDGGGGGRLNCVLYILQICNSLQQ
jgi:hypothetical protein